MQGCKVLSFHILLLIVHKSVDKLYVRHDVYLCTAQLSLAMLQSQAHQQAFSLESDPVSADEVQRKRESMGGWFDKVWKYYGHKPRP